MARIAAKPTANLKNVLSKGLTILETLVEQSSRRRTHYPNLIQTVR